MKYGLNDYIGVIDFMDRIQYDYKIDVCDLYTKKIGLPQGFPLSRFLFELVVHDITSQFNKSFKIFTYVDDITILIDKSSHSEYVDHFK